MLKACWDCIVGYNNANSGRAENDGAYGIRLNGDTQRAPPWPQPRDANEIMFLMPRPLKPGDCFTVSGQIRNNPQMFSVNLMKGGNEPDYNNIVCQIEARFPPTNENKITVRIIENSIAEDINGDYQDTPATEWFSVTSFDFKFTLRLDHYDSGHNILVEVGPSHLHTFNLKHNIEDIRFLLFTGDVDKVDKLDFQFV